MPVVHTLKGKEIVFTGRSPEGRAELSRLALAAGAQRVSADVNQTTSIFVRGEHNPAWSHGNFGKREELVADLQRRGFGIRIISLDGFRALVRGESAPTLPPHTATPSSD
ncbi:hypothetical protein EQW78_04670 [Oerskovia turbata]|uniref:BRCT domain-containing protein n=1 Tax=Oerskovia turbata TaxID=1713 RepID=A0A4Q1KZ03_9CELL|nr:hypothetical protein [Oerskovia turbata]RXR27934.1 hypothetical protein EQW73_01080 [Oerskovia turbata]RXR35628.1 hypothetical protein EQW78_04670 [Oerskovia turbata]